MIGKTHFHIIIWAADDRIEQNFSGITYVDVIAESVDTALMKVKKLVPLKRHYWVNNIVEHHNHESIKE